MKIFKTVLSILLAGTLILPLGDSKAAEKRPLIDDVYFFGDSTTAHLAVRGEIARERVWSGEGSTMLFTSVCDRAVKIDGEMMTLAEAAARYRPKILVITVGASGGAGFLKEGRFKSIYKKMLDGVKIASPETKIIVQSIYPLSDRSVKYYKKLTRQAVVEANGWIRDVCREENVPYVDAHSILVDKNGYLRPEYQNDEYLHLTSAAYRAILSNLEAYLEMHKDIYN